MFETLRSFFDPPITADPEQSTAKLAWVVRLRWVALTAQLLSIVPALEFQLLEPADAAALRDRSSRRSRSSTSGPGSASAAASGAAPPICSSSSPPTSWVSRRS